MWRSRCDEKKLPWTCKLKGGRMSTRAISSRRDGERPHTYAWSSVTVHCTCAVCVPFCSQARVRQWYRGGTQWRDEGCIQHSTCKRTIPWASCIISQDSNSDRHPRMWLLTRWRKDSGLIMVVFSPSPPLLGWYRLASSFVWWCSLPFLWVVPLSASPLVCGAPFTSLLFGGAAVLRLCWVVLLHCLPCEWCCFPSLILFRWRSPPPPAFGGAVVLRK